MMKRLDFHLLPTVLGALLALGSASGQAANSLSMVGAQADATITRHPGLGGGAAPLGAADTLYAIAPAGYEAASLLRFDLSAWAGHTLQGDAQIELGFLGLPLGTSVGILVRPVGSAWDEYSVTWNNFSPNLGAAVGGSPVTATDYLPGDPVAFGLPAALVQQWIAQPASNHGLLLQASNGSDLYLASREYRPQGGSAGDWAPRLSFMSAAAPVPETRTWALMGLGLAALGALRRR